MQIHTTKYDGSLHYRFEAAAIHHTDGFLAVYQPPGTAVESHRGPRLSEYQSLMLYWLGRRWSLKVHWKADWTPIEHYVDVITLPDWSDGTLRLNDLDLDLILRPELSGPILDDADEFADHTERFGYPPDLVQACSHTVFEVAAMMTRREPPFHGVLHCWRPDVPLMPLLAGARKDGLVSE